MTYIQAIAEKIPPATLGRLKRLFASLTDAQRCEILSLASSHVRAREFADLFGETKIEKILEVWEEMAAAETHLREHKDPA